MINSNRKTNPKIYIRAVIAIIMLAVWLLVAVSGVVLWLAPEGQRSGRIPLLFDMTKSDWKEVHLWLAAIMVAITVIHVIIDWKTLRAVIKYMVSVHRNTAIDS
ncbi:MAG: DUF4405 domain-containing protein [Dehalococcoidia bacterium]|nr:MAG: DUF4405 domain-containing protein [Dehalococcoidia bacterium]